jgi:hypothetical protein
MFKIERREHSVTQTYHTEKHKLLQVIPKIHQTRKITTTKFHQQQQITLI